MLKQIDAAVDNLNSPPPGKQEKIKAILARYALGEISLDQAYYDLLDEELIPMPQRCAVFAKIPLTEEDEIQLKEKIRGVLSETIEQK